jgi:hypothetical protein
MKCHVFPSNNIPYKQGEAAKKKGKDVVKTCLALAACFMAHAMRTLASYQRTMIMGFSEPLGTIANCLFIKNYLKIP